MTDSIKDEILDRVSPHVAQFVEPGATLAVACSGGKDSTLACLVLAQLGYNVHPIIVDMHYQVGWSEAVGNELLSLGFQPDILSTRSHSDLDSSASRGLHKNLLALSVIDSKNAQTSPCTSCYNSKVILIEQRLKKLGINLIAFGHHRTDAVSSLMKSALMYVDRWTLGNTTYDARRFRQLARIVSKRLSRTDSADSLFEKLNLMIAEGFANTDEAPVQELTVGAGTHIVRPLFHVWEHEVIESVRPLRTKIAIQPSGCGHTSSQSSQTPREIVQSEIVNALETRHSFRESMDASLTLCLQPDGKSRVDVRRLRDQLLGSTYKPAPSLIQKL